MGFHIKSVLKLNEFYLTINCRFFFIEKNRFLEKKEYFNINVLLWFFI